MGYKELSYLVKNIYVVYWIIWLPLEDERPREMLKDRSRIWNLFKSNNEDTKNILIFFMI